MAMALFSAALSRRRHLFWRSGPSSRAMARITDDECIVYAVGDVHGCLDQLREMETQIADVEHGSTRAVHVVYLGDLIDRGPNSAGVLDHLLAPPPAWLSRHCVVGNHEVAMLRFLAHCDRAAEWLDFGGVETLRSYSVFVPRRIISRRMLKDLVLQAQASIPDKHIQFLRALPITLSWRQYLFVHAGLRAGIPLEHQSQRDMLEMRDLPKTNEGALSVVVVHGHVPVQEPQHGASRISLDTACYATGRLSAARLDKDAVSFYSVSPQLD